MILTCPKCATRFFAEDHAIGPAGRSVQCSVCQEVWFSGTAGTARPPERAQASDTAIESAAPVAAPLFVERAAPARKAGRKAYGRSWAMGLLILSVVVVAGMFVFRRQLEQVFPGASAVYQSVGLRSSERAGG